MAEITASSITFDTPSSYAEYNSVFETPTGQIRKKFVEAKTYKQFSEACDTAIDFLFRLYEQNPQYKQGMGEDQISMSLVENLIIFGVDASHDTMRGGHCDIVIDGPNGFSWLGEAKIHNGYNWLLQGFQQLDTRYMAPTEGRDRGGMIIYCFNRRSDQVMEAWRDHLLRNRSDVTLESYDNDHIRFVTSHKHDSNGKNVYIRHSIAALYHMPDDKKKLASGPRKSLKYKIKVKGTGFAGQTTS